MLRLWHDAPARVKLRQRTREKAGKKKAPLIDEAFFTNQNETFLFFLGLTCLNNFFFNTCSLT